MALTLPRIFLCHSRTHSAVPVPRSLKDSPEWKSVSAAEQLELTTLEWDATCALRAAHCASCTASIAAAAAKSRKSKAERQLSYWKEWYEMSSNDLELQLGDRLRYWMDENSTVMIEASQLSLHNIICEVEEMYLSPEELCQPHRDQWILICSRNGVLFEKLRGCSLSWTTEADIADIVVGMYDKTSEFCHTFKIDVPTPMDLPEEVATEETMRLVEVLADEVGYAVRCFTSHPPYKTAYVEDEE